MKKYIIISALIIATFQLFGQYGIKNQGGIIKVDNGASVKITGTNAGFKNYEDGLVDLDGVIELEGNWYNDSGGDPVFININGIGDVKFTGTSAQNIGGSNYTYFENLYLNNPSGVSLGYFTQVDSILSLTSTILELDQYNMQIGSVDNLDGSFGVSNMIVSSNGGYFKFKPKLNTYNIIPLGDVTGTAEYSKFYIKPYTGTTLGTNALISVRVVNSKHANNSSGADYINRYWQVSSSDITNLNARIYGFYTSADVVGTETNLSPGQYVNSLWSEGEHISTSSNYIRFGNLSELGDFTAGEASVFEVSIAINNEATINEGAEDGASILVTLSNGEFVANPNVANWEVNNLPQGVSLGSVSYLSSTTVRLYLSGNRTTDYDSPITDVEVMVDYHDVNNLNSGWISDDSGVTITASNDAESLSMADDGLITEGSESGETITVTLTGGTFSDPLNSANWVLNNLPAGVNYTITRTNSTSVSITLTSNTTEDYDTDITNFEVIVPESDIDDHTGSNLSVNTGVTFEATVETYSIAMGMVSSPINEGSESGEVIWVKITDDTFVSSLTDSHWILNNLPDGVTKTGTVNRIADDSVQITLSGNRTIDYDANISNMSITIDADQITTDTNNIIVSSGVVFTALNDAESIALSLPSVINEGSENSDTITVALTNGTFYSSLDKTKWSITNLPQGVRVDNVIYVDATKAYVILSGNTVVDYDADIDINLSIDKSQLADVDASISGAGQVVLKANNDAESIAISGAINEGEEDGSTIEVVLTGGTYNSPLDENNFTVTNLPTGVEVDEVSYVNSTKVNIILIGNASEDYDTDITNTTVVVNSAAFSVSDGNISDNSGVTFTATDEQAEISLSADVIAENNENGKVITVNLDEDVFAVTIDATNCIVHNLPSGVTVGNYTRGDTELSLTLSGNRDTDFDTDIDSVFVEITGSGLQQHSYDIKSDSITIIANDDSENLTVVSKTITEGNEDGAVIKAVLSGGTFVSSPNLINWSITNGPAGVSIGSVSYISFDTVKVTLQGNASADYDTDIELGLLVDKAEIDDYLGSPIEITEGVTFEATIEPITMSISNNNGVSINEGSENGAEILVTLENDEFIATLLPSAWTVSYLPFGVSVDTIIRQNDDISAIIKLKGNSTKDYDYNIDTVKVEIQGTQFVNQHVNLSDNSGVSITANNDDESISFITVSIDERDEDNSQIEVNLTGGTYAEALNDTSWTISGQPSGVSIGSVFRNSSTLATITLSGVSNTDYDSDLTSFAVSVLPNQVDEHSNGDLSTTGNVTFTAIIEQLSYNIPLGTLNEDNINESKIELSVSGDVFVDYGLDVNNFVLNNAPAGLTIGAVEYVDDNRADVMLSYDRTDFDDDYDNITITLKGAEIVSGVDITTGAFSVEAVIELPYIEISDNSITEGDEDLKFIKVSLFEDEFKQSLNLQNWTVDNLPVGVTVSSLDRIDSVTVNVNLQGNRGQDYDADITNTSVTILADELIEGLSDVSASSGVIFIAFNDDETISLNTLDIQEGNEDGQTITINLQGGTFANNIATDDWQFSNLPEGVQVTNITVVDSVTSTIQLVGYRTDDYDSDIENFKVIIPASDVNDIISGQLEVATGVSFIAKTELLSTTVAELAEGSLDGASVVFSLTDDSFADDNLVVSSFSLVNNITGLSIDTILYKNDTAVSVLFKYNNFDFDTDHDIQLEIDAAELFGVANLQSNIITLKANDDDETVAMSSDGNGIFEGEESGEVISVSLSGGSFNSPLTTNEWLVFGMPEGVEYTISLVDLHTVNIELTTNTTIDYDNNIIDFSISVPASDVSDYTGNDFQLSGSVIFTAYVESSHISASLSESNLDGSTIPVVLTNEKFIDGTLEKDNFVLNNAPIGVTVSSVSYTSETEASVILAFDNTDFDTDVTDFTITVIADEIRGQADLSSDTLTITAVVEPENITISHSGLTEENLDNASVALLTSYVKFADATLDINNFTLNNAPKGCSLLSVTYVTDSTATIVLDYDNTDFDIDAEISITVSANELTVSSSITSNNLSVDANDDNEVISLVDDGEVKEGAEDGEQITITIEGGDFIESPDFSNWVLHGMPLGVEAENFVRVNDTAAQFQLKGNRTRDFDDNLLVNIEIPVTDVNEVSENIFSTYGFDIIAFNDAEEITMTDDGEIAEGAEDGEKIVVSITGGTFTTDVKKDGFVITNLPLGVEIGSVTVNSPTQVTLELLGNTTGDYDGDINAILEIDNENIFDFNEDIYTVNGGVVFIGNYELEDRVLNVSADGISEDNLSGFVLQLQIAHDKFVDETIGVSSFILNNAPVGVAISSVSYTNENNAEITLSYDGTDFDVDITDFSVEIVAQELVSAVNLVSGNKTITAIDETPTLTASHPGLNELNLNGAELSIALDFDTFVDGTIPLSSITLNNAPAGLTVGSFTYIDETSATLVLSFDNTDFDTDIVDFSIAIDAVELTSATKLTSNDLTIIAADEENGSLLASVSEQMTEDNLSGFSIKLQLAGETFADNTFDLTNIVLSDIPKGVTAQSIAWVSNTEATLELSYTGADFDNDFNSMIVEIEAAELTGADSLVSNTLSIIAVNDAEFINLSTTVDIVEGSEDGAIIIATLTGGTYVNTLQADMWWLSNLPSGVDVDTIELVSMTQANIVLSGNSQIDYDEDKEIGLTVNNIQVDDFSGAEIYSSNTALFHAVVELPSVSISNADLTEDNVNGQLIGLNLTEMHFVTSNLEPSHFTLINSPQGLSISEVVYYSEDYAQLVLSFDSTDFDSNKSISVMVNSQVLSIDESKESNTLTVVANNDEESFVMNDDGEIIEGAEDGEVVTLILKGGDFVDNVTLTGWVFNNLPSGVIVGAVERVSDTLLQFMLTGNSVVDYDTNLTQFEIQVPESAFNDYSGDAVAVKGGVTFIAVQEDGSLSISNNGLNEQNINGATINLLLSDIGFAGSAKSIEGITLNNAPQGLSVEVYTIISDTTATIELGYTGGDFDVDFPDFTITLEAGLLTPAMELTSNILPIYASVEPVVNISFDGYIEEGSEAGELITISLIEGKFVSVIDIDSIYLSNVPTDIKFGNINIVSDTLLTFQFTNNRLVDYDEDISEIVCTIEDGLFKSFYGQPVNIETDILFTAFNEQLTISHEGLNESNLNGAAIELVLVDDYFVNTQIENSAITLSNAPFGTSVSSIDFVNDTTAILNLAFDGTDFSSTITNFFIELDASELFSINNLISNNLEIEEGTSVIDGSKIIQVDIFSNKSTVFVRFKNEFVNMNSAKISIFDVKGKRIYYSELDRVELNKIDLNVITGNYLVKVNINGMEFVNKVFILPE